MAMWIRLCLLACFAGLARCPPGILDNLKKGLLHQLGKGLFGQLIKYNSSKSQCSSDMSYARHSITKEKWAMQMVDAIGKIESGALKGKITWTGDYDECLDVLAPAGAYSTGFKGQFCWMNFLPAIGKIKIPLKIGGCFPNTCDEKELMKNYNDMTSFLGKVPVLKKVIQQFNLTSISCVLTTSDWSTSTIAYLIFSALMISVIIVATATDLFQRKRANQCSENEKDVDQKVHFKNILVPTDSTDLLNSDEEEGSRPLIPSSEKHIVQKPSSSSFTEILLCFSALKSTSAILDMKHIHGEINCLHGIRFLSMTWVILGHTSSTSSWQIGNITDYLKYFNDIAFQAVYEIRLSASVNTFFLLSGFLLAYSFLRDDRLPKSIGGWIYFYVHRYIRLTPAYAMVLAFRTTMWDIIGSGPFWKNENQFTAQCYKTWWMNLLYINNFQDDNTTCMGHSWYLAVDMQFFIISPLFIISLKRWPVIGVFLSICTILASSLATFFVSYTNDVRISTQGKTLENIESFANSYQTYFDLLYTKPFYRIGPYLIGMLLAYFLLRKRNQKRIGNKWIAGFGWASSTACALWLIYGSLDINDGVWMDLYLALSPPAWALSVAWVIFACTSGYGGLVNDLLSMKFFMPLSRLTYTAYLVHYFIMTWYYKTLRSLIYFEITTVLMLYLAFLLVSFGTGFVVSVLIEMPFVYLEKQLMRKK